MKPIQLTMVAFGSFPEKEVIQFDALGESPLFLINGPTGSGKTTILDAICFALYGETTGEEREARQMRCDFAHGDILTEVALVFELAGQRYHIRRVPEQLRPKARGEGTTTHSPEAQLWRLKGALIGAGDVEAVDVETADESDVIVSSKVKDATLEIEKITGLTVNQFRQVMVLPQGKFRQLLLAESKDREYIFGKLFQTDIYKKLEDKLKQKANAIAREVESKQQLQQGVLEGAGLVDVDELDVALVEDKAALAVIVEKKKSLQEAVQNIEKQHQQKQTLEGLFQQLEKTQKTVDQLMSRQDAFSLQRKQIQMAEGAERIQPVDIESQRYREELKKADVALGETHKQLVEAERRQMEVDALKNNAKADLVALDENKKKQTYLESLQSRAQDFTQAQQAERSAKTKQQNLKQQLGKADAAWKAAERNQQLALEDVATLRNKVELNSELPLQHASWQKVLEIKQQSELLLKNVAIQEKTLVLLKEQGEKFKVAADNAIENTQRLTLAWHQGQAAVLAKALNVGEPCMVCGSLDHPVPAHLNSKGKLSADEASVGNKPADKRTVPSDDQLAAAREQEQQSHRQLLSAREKYVQQAAQIKSVKQQVSALCEVLGDDGAGSVATMLAEMERLTLALTQWQRNKEKLRRVQEHVDSLRSSEQHLVATLNAARAEEMKAQSHYAAALAVLNRAAEELPEDYRVQGALQTHIQRAAHIVMEAERRQQQIQQQWEAAAASCHSLVSQQQERQSAQKNVNEQCEAASQRWSDVLLASPFDSEDQYRSYQLDQHQLHEMKQTLLAFEKSLTESLGVLKQQKIQLADSTRPVLSESQGQLTLAKQAYDTVDAGWLVLDKRVSLLLLTQKTLKQMQAQTQKLEEGFTLFGTLSNVANGQTYEKISLQRFVLGVLLDDVLIEASQRLSLMSKGRYILLRKTEKAKGNKASGLELVVDDAYTGVQRPVATLSGGESFMAALSLALGLSDVVQAYSGGIRLDMLFIDEGFGSLDPESLELAIRTLLDLQKAGRMVGVISHVSDLKDQIPLRLDVVASHRGSHTELVGVLA